MSACPECGCEHGCVCEQDAPSVSSPPASSSAKLAAAENMDWQQVVLNGGPPCFHLCEDGNFCGRAQRWVGHKTMASKHVIDHDFVSLADLLRGISPNVQAEERP